MFTISNFTRSRITEKKAPEAPKAVDLLEGLTANKQDVLKRSWPCQP